MRKLRLIVLAVAPLVTGMLGLMCLFGESDSMLTTVAIKPLGVAALWATDRLLTFSRRRILKERINRYRKLSDKENNELIQKTI